MYSSYSDEPTLVCLYTCENLIFSYSLELNEIFLLADYFLFPFLFMRSPFLPFYFSKGIICSTPTDVLLLKCLIWVVSISENRCINKIMKQKFILKLRYQVLNGTNHLEKIKDARFSNQWEWLLDILFFSSSLFLVSISVVSDLGVLALDSSPFFPLEVFQKSYG